MIEGLLWGLIPAIAAGFAVLLSVCAAIAGRSPTHYIVSIIVISLAVWSLVILYRIFIQGAWPTFLPHVAIGLSVVIALIQFAYRKRNDNSN